MTLVEVVIALVIFTPILVLALGVVMKNIRGVVESWEDTKGTAVGQRVMNRIRRLKWDETTQSNGLAAVPSPIGTDALEVTPDTFDDIDDWNGLSAPDPLPEFARYSATVSVTYVTVNNGTGEITLSIPTTDIKRVDVAVTCPGGKIIYLSSLFTNSPP